MTRLLRGIIIGKANPEIIDTGADRICKSLFVKSSTKLTDSTPGNLGKQMELLEAEGFLTCRKELLGRRPRSTYALTESGRESFRAYVQMLDRIVGGQA